MEQVILVLGQAALLLASVVACLGMAYVAAWLLVSIVRKLRSLSTLD
jgi:hypothetical protein